ncbi:MAG: exodeoxyribonuclease III [Ruminococcus sp.]|nr:exodeoxyribonuclease III [Ruminococcus sp.]
MRLMTLNIHSLMTEDNSEKYRNFVDFLAKMRPDVVALQEVSQTIGASPMPHPEGLTECGRIPLKADNLCCHLIRELRTRGMHYHCAWLGIKCGYGKYDEGIAVLSRFPIAETKVLTVSRTDAYDNWKTRKILGIRTESLPDMWFFSVHYSWWNDAEEPMQAQWERTLAQLPDCRLWLMGDFNNPAECRGEGYDAILASGFYDTYHLAGTRSGSITATAATDGWHGHSAEGMRIDMILTNRECRVTESKVVCNGENGAVVSDHFGVMIEVML